MNTVDIQALEQKVLALVTFVTAHLSQIDQIKKDIQDIMAQIAALKEAK
jgi:hypothetical protein